MTSIPENAFWATLGEDSLDEEPLFFIEPKDRGCASEYDRQRAFMAHVKRHHPQCFIAAIPNASKDSDWMRLQKQREGAVFGFPDLMIAWNHGVMFAEFKSGTGKPSKNQIQTLNRLHRLGFRVGVYRTKEVLLAHLAEAGAPVSIGEES